MGWLEDLGQATIGKAEQQPDEPIQVVALPKPRKVNPTVQHVFVTVRLPSGEDTGEVYIGHYVVEGGVLTMTDANGHALSTKDDSAYRHELANGDDIQRIAWTLARKVRSDTLGLGAFSRRLNYPTMGIA